MVRPKDFQSPLKSFVVLNVGEYDLPCNGYFDANGNLLTLDNISTLHWHYNNTLNQLIKPDKNNTIEYYIYDYQGNRVRTVVESDHQVQSQRDYLPLLDISTNEVKQQTSTLHIGTHIFSESSKDNTQNPDQTRYQLTSHLQSVVWVNGEGLLPCAVIGLV
jgi:insecticidal toxin complex protein TccC